VFIFTLDFGKVTDQEYLWWQNTELHVVKHNLQFHQHNLSRRVNFKIDRKKPLVFFYFLYN
jgi:hypothetical protein